MEAGKQYQMQSDGYFVPDARMIEIMDALGKKELSFQK